jgi:hypothetical protein
MDIIEKILKTPAGGFVTIRARDYSFTSVVKGYRSLKKKTATLKEIMHQIIKSNITNPDYILLVLAKLPGDGVISYLINYTRDVGNRNLIILVARTTVENY